MDSRERLRRAQDAAADGRYEEALEGYIWFHENAHEPSMAGVRLSFAIGYWLELAKVYPAALHALEHIRDRKTAALLDGRGDRSLFHDVSSINESLGREDQTYSLFVRLQVSVPALAEKCGSLALPSIVKAGDLMRARSLIPDPQERVRRWGRMLNKDMEEYKEDSARDSVTRNALIHNYAQDTAELLEILRGVGEHAEAVAVHKQSLDIIQSTAVRETVDAQLEKHRAGVEKKGDAGLRRE